MNPSDTRWSFHRASSAMIPAGTKPQVLLAPPATDLARDTSGDAALCGSLEVVPIFDIIQWVCAGHQSWVVRVWAEGLDATVAIVDGELVDARCGSKTGHLALVELLETKAGRFELQPIRGELQRTLRGNWMATLLSAAQRVDEEPVVPRGRPSAQAGSKCTSDSGEYALSGQKLQRVQRTLAPPPSDPAFRTVPAPPAAESLHLIDLGFAAVKAGDIEGARLLWSQALEHDPNNRALQFNLRKLEELRSPTS